MDIQTYLGSVTQRARHLPLDKQVRHALLGMVTEAGELVDIFKRLLAYDKEVDTTHLLEECGDYLWYFVLWCWCRTVPMTELQKAHDTVIAQGLSAYASTPEAQDRMIDSLVMATALMLSEESDGNLDNIFRINLHIDAFKVVLAFLCKYGFTLEQCLEANDAKLEQRTGQNFDAAKFLSRNLEAEREVLEGHVKD